MRRASPAGRVCRRSVGAAAEGRPGVAGRGGSLSFSPPEGSPAGESDKPAVVGSGRPESDIPKGPLLPAGGSRVGISGFGTGLRRRGSAGQFSRWGPPTGIARERETRTNDAAPRQSHRCERRIATRAESRGHGALASSPGGGLRPASRGSAKPAPTTLRPANLTAANGASPPAQNRGDMERRVSDRHRAGARNLHRRRCAPPISPLRTTHRHPRRIAGTWSAGQFSRWGPPTGIARERETRTNNAAPRQSHRCERRIVDLR